MKVALLSRAFLPGTGGVETSSAMLARMCSEGCHEVLIVTAVPGQGIFEGLPVVRRWSVGSLAKAISWADITVTNGYSRLVVAVAGALGKPLIVLHQGYQLISSDGLGFRGRQFHDFSFRRDLALAWRESPSTALRALLRRAFDEAFRRSQHRVQHVVPSAHVRQRLRLPNAAVMYQPPNPQVADALESQPPLSAAQRRDSYVSGPICFFGRLVFEKGVDDLIRAYAQMTVDGQWGARSMPPSLQVFGDGPERPWLLELVRALKLESQVQFHGFLSGAALVRAARAASVVVIPSRWEEPGATIAVEMFLAGVPVVASASGAAGEIFRQDGRTFRNRDWRDLVAALTLHFLEGPRFPGPADERPWNIDTIRRTMLGLIDRGCRVS